NAKFTNGDPVTAEAVRWSFARTLKLNQGPAWMLSDFLKEDGIKVLNDHTIQFTLTQSYAPFLSFVPWWYVMNPKEVLAHQPGIVVPNFPGMTTFGLKMNTQKAPTSDANLRKAIAYAFDYDALVKIYNGNAVLQTSPFPNATKGHVAVPGFPRQDLAKAKELLAKSAYPSGGVELEYVYVQGLEEERKMGLVLTDNLV